MVYLKKGTLTMRGNEMEEQLMERVVSGSDPDPYVVIAVREGMQASIGAQTRVLDSWQSDYVRNSLTPVWNQSCFLFVSDPSTAVLSFRVMDKDFFKRDDLIGDGQMSIKEMLVSLNRSSWFPYLYYCCNINIFVFQEFAGSSADTTDSMSLPVPIPVYIQQGSNPATETSPRLLPSIPPRAKVVVNVLLSTISCVIPDCVVLSFSSVVAYGHSECRAAIHPLDRYGYRLKYRVLFVLPQPTASGLFVSARGTPRPHRESDGREVPPPPEGCIPRCAELGEVWCKVGGREV